MVAAGSVLDPLYTALGWVMALLYSVIPSYGIAIILLTVAVRLVLYPLSAFRAAAKAAVTVYGAIRRHGTQKSVLDLMQTRAELYEVLGYLAYEKKLDELFGKASDD